MITSIAYQKNPDPILWATLHSGTLVSMTYEREQDVVAWSRHPFQVGGGEDSELTGTTPTYQYPTLQELDASEIPDAPNFPAETSLSGSISVTDAAGLAAMTPGNQYSIDSDIDLSGVVWTPLTWNSASPIIIEGNNHTISNLSISAIASDNQALIGSWTGSGGGEIRNLTFTDCSVAGKVHSAILLAEVDAEGDILIRNIDFTNCTLTVGDRIAGCLAGELYSEGNVYIYDCDATNCTLTATASGSMATGLLFGVIGAGYPYDSYSLTISDCNVIGGSIAITNATASSVGGWCAQIYGAGTDRADINCYAYDCSSTATITITAPATATNSMSVIGGFCGFGDGVEFVSCEASGSLTFVTTSSWVDATDIIQAAGGFAGKLDYGSYLIDCSCSGDINIPDYSGCIKVWRIGGFVGLVDTTGVSPESGYFLRCYSTSDISVASDVCHIDRVGGFAGQVTGDGNQIVRCFCSGDVTFSGNVSSLAGDLHRLGGFVGSSGVGAEDDTATMQNCYTWSSVLLTSPYPSTNFYIGGFMGEGYDQDGSYITFENCYCAQTDEATGSGLTNQLPASDNTNGFAGLDIVAPTSDGSDIFCDVSTSGISLSAIGTGHVTRWMQTRTNYEAAGWDFDTIWYIPDDTTWDYSESGLGPNSVAVIPGSTEDEVWLVVSRLINGNVVRYLEQMQPRKFGAQEDAWFVDSGLDYDGASTTSFTGLDHLEGEEVAVWADGSVQARQTVTGGAITLSEAASRVIVGLPFRYKLQAMRFDLAVAGSTKGSLKRFAEVVVSFYETLNAQYGRDVDNLFNIDWRSEEAYGGPPAMYSGDKVLAHEGGYSVEDEFLITSDDPTPCTIRAIVPRIEEVGR